MPELADAHRHLQAAITELRAATESALASDAELLSALTVAEGLTRQLEHLTASTVATLQRRGAFGERGYKAPAAALSDLLGLDWVEARRRVTAAEQACERISLDGTVLPARLPATAKVFAAAQAGLRHVEVIATLLSSQAAGRLTEGQRVGLEEQLADKAAESTPAQLRAFGARLIERLDDDGPEPDDTPDSGVNELTIRRHPHKPGGTIKARFDDPAMFDSVAALLDAKAKPLTAEDTRGVGRRQAEALAEVCGWVLDHGEHAGVPETGGRKPHLNVLIRLDDLEQRARSGVLDFGGTLTPEALRMLACDAAVVPIVMNGAGQPLDVGRAQRTIPDGLRRAVVARDQVCAHPGCDRPPSWCEVHHIAAWENGGETRLDNLVLLCRQHHRLMHFSGWIVRICHDGLPEFIPPRWIDPDQKPRRNPHHDRTLVAAR